MNKKVEPQDRKILLSESVELGTKTEKGQTITDPNILFNEMEREASFLTGSGVAAFPAPISGIDMRKPSGTESTFLGLQTWVCISWWVWVRRKRTWLPAWSATTAWESTIIFFLFFPRMTPLLPTGPNRPGRYTSEFNLPNI